mgnify:CR=1 FL=1
MPLSSFLLFFPSLLHILVLCLLLLLFRFLLALSPSSSLSLSPFDFFLFYVLLAPTLSNNLFSLSSWLSVRLCLPTAGGPDDCPLFDWLPVVGSAVVRPPTVSGAISVWRPVIRRLCPWTPFVSQSSLGWLSTAARLSPFGRLRRRHHPLAIRPSPAGCRIVCLLILRRYHVFM